MADIVKQLDYIFKPRSVAVIGASDNVTKWGYLVIERPLRTGYKGAIYPVNPQADTILGLPSYRSVKDIPGSVDLAVITTQASHVPSVMQQCVDKGVKGAILISAGFAEASIEGKDLEEKVMAIARSGGIRCVGPNCMGIWSAAGQLNNAFLTSPKNGEIAFISQSGTFGGYMAELASAKGYGLRMFVSIGNQGDLNVADYIEYLSYDDETKAIILYMEGVKDGRRFFNVCREALKKKPIILYKGGSSPAGSRAVMSHTAAIAGSEIVFQNVCRQLGLIRAEESFQTFEMAIALLGQPLPPGRRFAILGTGGQSVASIDACQRLGLEVPELDRRTSERLMAMLPPHAPMPKNPVDFAGSYRTAVDEANVVEILLQQDYIDGVISNVPINPAAWGHKVENASASALLAEIAAGVEKGTKQFCQLPRKYNKPIVCVRWSSEVKKDTVAEKLTEAGIPVYETPEQCARAMYALTVYAELKRANRGV
ncbi:MAG: CoA-binding protein [Chloroflexi bacterium]|nr:CoA-binding protein [Chloroflexota bacterium]